MQYRYNLNFSGASIGCGAFLVLLGPALITPVVAWLIKGLGWTFIALGIVVVLWGIWNWLFGARHRNF